MITSKELRKKYIEFFESKGHKTIPSASLVPEGDASTLFISAGMQPLVPYLLGEKHPEGTRLVDVQKCLRTEDIEAIGSEYRNTFFEMLGNWSLGDYGREDSIPWSYEFLTSEKWLNLSKEKLFVTVFAGSDGVPEDKKAFEIWEKLGISKDHIFKLDINENFWITGNGGPCGPDTEIFFDTGKPKCSDDCKPSCKCGKYFEIWNNVFVEYNKTEDGKYIPLEKKCVDTGMGLERTLSVLNSTNDNYRLDVLYPLIQKIEELSQKKYEGNKKEFRVIADHVRAATFILSDPAGITPSNLDKGYVARKLIRRAALFSYKLGITKLYAIAKLSEEIVPYMYLGQDTLNKQKMELEESDFVYPELYNNAPKVNLLIQNEFNKFEEAISRGFAAKNKRMEVLKRFIFRKNMLADSKWINSAKKASGYNKDFTSPLDLAGAFAFEMESSYGLPRDFFMDSLTESNLFHEVDWKNHIELFILKAEQRHKELSRTATKGKFKGGLGAQGEETKRLHTATHLLLAALRKILDPNIIQRGSNINPERLRFDFNYPQKLTKEQIGEIEDFVNDAIQKKIEVNVEELSIDEAKKRGATGIFDDKYGNVVKVYTIGEESGQVSKEICGGPHVKNTSELGQFKIKKEEASSAGVRRIKAVLK